MDLKDDICFQSPENRLNSNIEKVKSGKRYFESPFLKTENSLTHVSQHDKDSTGKNSNSQTNSNALSAQIYGPVHDINKLEQKDCPNEILNYTMTRKK